MQKYSMSDIARICGVSKATISRVINNKSEGVGEATRNRILSVVDELNYRPNSLARSVATSKSKLVGLIIPDVSNLFYPAIIRGVTDALEIEGYSLILCNSNYDPIVEKKQMLNMIDNRVDGVILASGVSNEEFLNEYKKYHVPLALIGRTFDTIYSDTSITGDNVRGAEMALDALVKTGNRRILFLDGRYDVSGSKQRRSGYLNGLKKHGIDADNQLIRFGDFSIEYGFNAINDALGSGLDFTAVQAGSDLIAIGAVKALKRHGYSIPRQIEIIGFDGIELSEIYDPKISTVLRPHRDIAYQAARNLMKVIKGTIGDLRHITIEPILVVRETSKRLND